MDCDGSTQVINETEEWKGKYEKLLERCEHLEATLEAEAERVGEAANELSKTKECMAKYKALVGVVEEWVRCPVCLDIPTTGPVHPCPQGHLTCSSCHQGPGSACPVCRAAGPLAFSLLAAAALQAIDHQCRFEGCQVKVAVDKMEEHREKCTFRPINCPSFDCKAEVAYAHIVEHMMYECAFSVAKENGQYKAVEETARHSYYFADSSSVDTIQWMDQFFFLTSRVQGSYRNFYLQMAGSQEDCDKYQVTIHMMNKEGRSVTRALDQPHPLEMKEEDKTEVGLPVSHKKMRKLSYPMAGVYKCDIMVDFSDVE